MSRLSLHIEIRPLEVVDTGHKMVDKFEEYGIAAETVGAGVNWNFYNADKPYNSNPAREVEIVYDYSLLQCTDTTYPILEERFEAALSRNEKVLEEHMDQLLIGERVSVLEQSGEVYNEYGMASQVGCERPIKKTIQNDWSLRVTDCVLFRHTTERTQ